MSSTILTGADAGASGLDLEAITAKAKEYVEATKGAKRTTKQQPTVPGEEGVSISSSAVLPDVPSTNDAGGLSEQTVVPDKHVEFGTRQGDATALLTSMKQAQEAPVPPPVIDLLGFFNGLHLNPDEEQALREHAIAVAKQEAESEEFVDTPFADQSKVEVALTETSRALFRVFASDFGRNAESEKAYRLATGKEYGRAGLRDVAGAFYGVLCGHDPDGHPVRACLGSAWWRRASRLEGDIRVITEVTVVPTDKPDDPSTGVFNRFHLLRRKAVRPDLTATRDDIKVFDDHLLVSAGGCEVTREYVLDWLAFLYQNPGRKPATALAFCSAQQGTGKSWFQYPLKWVFGPDLVGVTGGDALYENFDDPFIGKWIAHIDELPDPKKKRNGTDANAKIKRFVTADVTTMRPLGVKATPHRTPSMVITCDSVANLVAVIDGRRLCIVYNPGAPEHEAYYKRLFAWAGEEEPGPGMAKLAGYLNNRDVSKFNPKAHAPITAAKVLAKSVSLSSEAKFLGLLFEEGHALFDRDFSRVLDFHAKLETYFANKMPKGLNFSPDHLPSVFKELGWKKIGVHGTYQTSAKADQAWCWRNWEKWGDANTPRKERIDHTTGGVPLTMHNGGLSQ